MVAPDLVNKKNSKNLKDGVVVIFGVFGVFLGSFFSLGHEFDCCLGLGSS